MARARLTCVFLGLWFALAAAVPAAAQQAARPTATPARPVGRPTGNRPRPVTPPPNRPGNPGNRPPARPTARPPARPTPRPTSAPWRPNRPPQVRPPGAGWNRPAWANRPRPSWARNNGWRPNYILVNPRAFPNAWGWNRGLRWNSNTNYWGGGFWGPFAPFGLAAGAAIWNQTRFFEPAAGSPGWWLFQNYGLVPARCGPQNLVYIYGPNDGVMCAFPNMYVPAGFYYVDPATLTLFVM
jgi:hypothetical protein